MGFYSRRRTDGCCILVVEDSDNLRLLMQTALESEGYCVDSVGSAEAGARLIEARRYDLVLTDYRLPGRSGSWLLRHAVERNLLERTATFLVTAEPEVPEMERVARVVAKPVDFDHFLPQIRAILGDLRQARGSSLTAAETNPRQDAPALDGSLVDLTLYVSPSSPSCAHAQRTLRRLLESYDPQQISLRVCDVTNDVESATCDHVIFTPSLVRRTRSSPSVWVLGDLSKSDIVRELLRMSGLRPVAPNAGDRSPGPGDEW